MPSQHRRQGPETAVLLAHHAMDKHRAPKRGRGREPGARRSGAWAGRGIQDCPNPRQRRDQGSLHVQNSPAVEPAVPLVHSKGGRRPAARVAGRDHIHMAVEHQRGSAVAPRAPAHHAERVRPLDLGGVVGMLAQLVLVDRPHVEGESHLRHQPGDVLLRLPLPAPPTRNRHKAAERLQHPRLVHGGQDRRLGRAWADRRAVAGGRHSLVLPLSHRANRSRFAAHGHSR